MFCICKVCTEHLSIDCLPIALGPMGSMLGVGVDACGCGCGCGCLGGWVGMCMCMCVCFCICAACLQTTNWMVFCMCVCICICAAYPQTTNWVGMCMCVCICICAACPQISRPRCPSSVGRFTHPDACPSGVSAMTSCELLFDLRIAFVFVRAK